MRFERARALVARGGSLQPPRATLAELAEFAV